MKQSFLITLFITFTSLSASACSCVFAWNDSFSLTAKESEFVALVKIISFDEYLEDDFASFEDKKPYSMTVEIIKKFKGKEQRRRIKIFGDNGMLCRPYLSEFEINGYYLIAPIALNNKSEPEYEFFSCRTDYLEVDIARNKAYGNYSIIRKQIDISTFENKLIYGDWDFAILGLICSMLIITALFVKRIKNRKI